MSNLIIKIMELLFNKTNSQPIILYHDVYPHKYFRSEFNPYLSESCPKYRTKIHQEIKRKFIFPEVKSEIDRFLSGFYPIEKWNLKLVRCNLVM